MPQAALPDLNTQWIIAVREVWAALKNRNYSHLFGSLQNINALLPKDFQIDVDDVAYQKAIDEQQICIICPSCKVETKRQDIKVQQLLTNPTVSIITGHKTEKVWECNSCHQLNMLSKSKLIKNVLPQPCYLKVVPSPPNRSSDLSDRHQYHQKVVKWALQFLNELQHQMSLFRLTYRPKDEESGETVPEGGEEFDV